MNKKDGGGSNIYISFCRKIKDFTFETCGYRIGYKFEYKDTGFKIRSKLLSFKKIC